MKNLKFNENSTVKANHNSFKEKFKSEMFMNAVFTYKKNLIIIKFQSVLNLVYSNVKKLKIDVINIHQVLKNLTNKAHVL